MQSSNGYETYFTKLGYVQIRSIQVIANAVQFNAKQCQNCDVLKSSVHGRTSGFQLVNDGMRIGPSAFLITKIKIL